jgi:NADH:ubiquinone oxidoreductase subunit C
MDTITIMDAARPLFEPFAARIEQPDTNRLDIYLPANSLQDVTRLLLDSKFYLSAITGVDVPPAEDREGEIEVLYHFCQWAVVVTLRLRVPYSKPVVDSLCGIIPSATLYERELIEMFGVTVEGTTSTERLLLSDDWPEGVYPLRKSFEVKE